MAADKRLFDQAEGEEFPRERLKWIFVAGFWGLIILLSFGSNLVHVPSCRTVLQAISITDLPNYGTWALLSPLILWLSRKIPLGRTNWPRRVGVLFLVGILISFVQAIPPEVVNVLSYSTPEHEKSLSHSLLYHILPGMPVKFLIFCAILGIGYAFEYYGRFHERSTRLSQLERQLVQARLDTLKSQLHPHFLFNTLNAISALVERNPATTRRMIARLSELLRLTLDNKDKQEITLEQELSLLKLYLEIEQVRFQDRLRLEYNIAPNVGKALVPNMILQPLVENAIKHGINQRRTAGRIRISVAHEDGFLKMAVEDDGPGLTDESRKATRTGLGIKNTQSRLRQLYGNQHKFDLLSLKQRGVRVSIMLPFHKTAMPLTE
ncbi:histidine kinase [candidate division KSB1 bacterium]|nr:histidine kinase [candidate division KSB1 bacterium]NIR68535.1 histidine kinase [candidate division KSB1 bacterium]NIS22762.1 histidine kinase [candidate division KSB1 bacterium]NIT69393.1 histidine kinase [candidate division KSB1 bacterium]NIU23270.1 histidine kinase [candidate division KSB1 bacterium]